MSRVALIFGGRSTEHRVSVDSARTVARGLAEAGHEVVPFGIARGGAWRDPEASGAVLAGGAEEVAAPASGDEAVAPTLGPFLEARVEVAFPIVHGTWGEDGSLQGLFESLDLPYVGAGVTASAVAMDKTLSKRLLAETGVPVVEFEPVARAEMDEPGAVLARLERLPLPLFVKPSVGGSSVGVRKVKRREELADALEFALGFDDAAVVERGVEGRELECAVLGYPRLEASAVGEIVPGREFYDYADKYLESGARLDAPAKLAAPVEARVRELAVAAFAALGGTGMARVDFLLEGDSEVFVNEVNTLPGFTKISMYPILWEISGVPLPELVDRLVAAALARHRDRHRLDRGIRDWLAGLG